MRKQLRAYVIATCGLAMLGCSTAENPSPASVAAPIEVEDHPAPVARIEVDADRAIEFYEYPSGVLVMETGVASGKVLLPTLRDKVEAGEFVDIATTLRPDLPPPEALVALQARDQAPRTTGTARVARAPQTQVLPPAGGYASTLDSGCGNNCCNASWVQNNLCGTAYDYTWFLLDYGWSFENFGSVSRFDSAVCAANGTSTFNVDMGDGSGGTWSVPEGHYRWFYWHGGCYIFNCPATTSANSSVNKQSNQHLHTYCGGVWY
jgi:hypothetical protein